MGKNKRWVYAHAFKGEPKVSDFELVEEDIPPLKDGGKSLILQTSIC
jgi:NADPH-dependent curcumin reductase CurA